MGKVDDQLIDAVLLSAAAKIEHVEIAMYELEGVKQASGKLTEELAAGTA